MPRRRTGFDQQLAYDFTHLLFEVRVVQSAQSVEAVHGVADCNLAVDDACAHGAEHLASSACDQTAPNPPVLAPMTATGLYGWCSSLSAVTPSRARS